MNKEAFGQGRRYRRRYGRWSGGAGAGMGRTGAGMGRTGVVSDRTGLGAAVAALLVTDLRDPEGVTRPLLRGAAGRLATSRVLMLQRAGSAYLRVDPPMVHFVEPRPPAVNAGDWYMVPGAPRTAPAPTLPAPTTAAGAPPEG